MACLGQEDGSIGAEVEVGIGIVMGGMEVEGMEGLSVVEVSLVLGSRMIHSWSPPLLNITL